TCSSAKSDRPTIPRLPRLRLRRPLLPSKTGHAEKGLGEAGAEARVASDEHVLQHGKFAFACRELSSSKNASPRKIAGRGADRNGGAKSPLAGPASGRCSCRYAAAIGGVHAGLAPNWVGDSARIRAASCRPSQLLRRAVIGGALRATAAARVSKRGRSTLSA